jgi:hypothetical protein
MINIINFELYIIKMKSISILILAASSVATCLDIMGIELPEPERLSKQERKLGMPFLHDHPQAILGNKTLINYLIGCEHVTDTTTLDEEDPCHHKNIKL